MTHEEVLAGNYKITFRTFVPTPTVSPDIAHNGLKIWYVQDGFICVSPMSGFTQGNCKFVFPYKVGGGRAYIGYFAQIEPLKYRQVRNSGAVQISGNKNPVPYKKAIAIIYKRINEAIACNDKWDEGRTRIRPTYINNAILNESGERKAVVLRNGLVYTLFVDFRQLRADYRELISIEHIMKLYTYVSDSKILDNVARGIRDGRNLIWEEEFGFSKNEFTDSIENCTK
jgi:hypothetical protein